jgi:hypothetical protein
VTFEAFEAGVERTRALLKQGTAPNHLVRMVARDSRPCRDCGLMIYLIPCKDNSVQPFDGDGQSHYVTCPKAENHRRRIGPMGASDYKPSKYGAAPKPAAVPPPPPASHQESLFGSPVEERYPD